jgi:subtilisin family serine protease
VPIVAETLPSPESGRDSLTKRSRALLSEAGLERLTQRTSGSLDVRIALLDGAIHSGHPAFASAHLEHPEAFAPRALPGAAEGHATSLASVLVGDRQLTLGLCRGCSLVSIPVINERFAAGRLPAILAAQSIAEGIRQAIVQRVDLIQISIAFDPEEGRAYAPIVSALAVAASHGIVTIIASGNGGHLAASSILATAGVIPVAASLFRRPDPRSSIGLIVGLRGVLAPGVNVPAAVLPAEVNVVSGTSVAACFVTATFALLRTLFPRASAAAITWALVRPTDLSAFGARSIVPPQLDGEASFQCLCRLSGVSVNETRRQFRERRFN